MTHILLDALLLPPSDAENAWRKWRASVDLDRIDPEEFLSPAHVSRARLPAWTANDPQQGILLGICRRAWSENQSRRKSLAEAIASLNAAGIDRVSATGPALAGDSIGLRARCAANRTVDLPDRACARARRVRCAYTIGLDGSQWPVAKRWEGDFFFGYRVEMRGPDGSELRSALRGRCLIPISRSRRPAVPGLEPIPAGAFTGRGAGRRYARSIGLEVRRIVSLPPIRPRLDRARRTVAVAFESEKSAGATPPRTSGGDPGGGDATSTNRGSRRNGRFRTAHLSKKNASIAGVDPHFRQAKLDASMPLD